MKQSWISRSLPCLLALFTIALLLGHDISSAGEARTQVEPSPQSVPAPQQLSPEGQASLRAIIQAQNLSDLRWPDFSDYSRLMTEFYQSYGYFLPWVRGMEPSAEAQQVIAILKNADQEGLFAEDFDGPRKSAGVAKATGIAPLPSETDAVG